MVENNPQRNEEGAPDQNQNQPGDDAPNVPPQDGNANPGGGVQDQGGLGGAGDGDDDPGEGAAGDRGGMDAGHRTFARTPGQSAPNKIIHFDTRYGQTLYRELSSGFLDEDSKFGGNPGEINLFCSAYRIRAASAGWDSGIDQIPEDITEHGLLAGPFKNMTDSHGELSLEHIAQFEGTYIDKECRSSQDTYMKFNAILNSLTKECKEKVMVWQDQMKANGIYSGNLIFKILMRESSVDSTSTTQLLQKRIQDLYLYMATVSNDVVKFNIYVKKQTEALNARGHLPQNLTLNLFKAYLTCPDTKFNAYIQRKEDAFNEGEDISDNKLMTLAADKYRGLKEKDEWEAPSPEEEKIQALEAALAKLKKHGKGKGKAKGKGKVKGQEKDSKKEHGKRGRDDKWRFENKSGKKTITKDGKKWYWCSKENGGKCQGAWRRHSPSDCKGTAAKVAKKEESTDSKRALKAQAALASTQFESDSDSSE